jgi:hypothetical protein
MCRRVLPGVVLVATVSLLGLTASPAAERSYNLPSVDLKQPVIWGATYEGPDGSGLSFGGQDQRAEDGLSHTCVKQEGKWVSAYAELYEANPFQAVRSYARRVVGWQREATARGRYAYFHAPAAGEAEWGTWAKFQMLQKNNVSQATNLMEETKRAARDADEYAVSQSRHAARYLERAAKDAASAAEGVMPETIQRAFAASVSFELAAEAIDCEPPPRALSPIVYDGRTKLYVLFGGDHCDYLTNDTWVFDPAKPRWMQRHPPFAPPPRANHKLVANGDGTVTLTGGYTYTSNTDYCGGQYKDIGDGTWTYDIAADRWSRETGTGSEPKKADAKEKASGEVPVPVSPGVPPDQRTYRTGPFHPDFFLEGPKPDRAAVKKQLDELPANTWVAMNPPRLPKLNRDWGSAVIDPDHDVMLRFSGGHSAHGGTDVLHYHFATNRWELPFPVEFPLGQLYSNTSYPEGFNFNRRPWVTGHTYQSYGYEPTLKKMLFVGQTNHYYVWDPEVAEWTGRGPKPKGMAYDSCFYDLTLCNSPVLLYAWSKNGEVFDFDTKSRQWGPPLKLTGDKLPGSVVDNSTMVYDGRRERLLFARKPYGDKHTYDGQLHALDLKTLAVSALSPTGSKAAAAIPYLCELRYDAEHDLVLVGGTLPPEADGLRRTPAYDPGGNRWVSLRIGGQDPSGKEGRNVSLGLMYDGGRKLFWAVDTNSQVYVLRLDPKTADLRAL